MREVIEPALERGATVICDRFYDSTLAYQGVGRGVEEAGWLETFQERVTNGLVPHRTYWIAIAPEAAHARRVERGAADRMERAGLAFQERVAGAYENLALAHPERILRLDGEQSISQLEAAIWQDAQSLQAGTTPIRQGSS